MNCPNCGGRNPSNASRCLHCSAQLEPEGGGFFDVESSNPNAFWNNKTIGMTVAGAIGLFVIVALFLTGFDTYDVKCTSNSEQIAAYSASPDWTRDQSAERRREARRRERLNQRKKMIRVGDYSHRCFKKKTGHVKGALEE